MIFCFLRTYAGWRWRPEQTLLCGGPHQVTLGVLRATERFGSGRTEMYAEFESLVRTSLSAK